MMAILTPRSIAVIQRPSSPFRLTPVVTPQLTQVYLHPGQVHASADPCAITTVLGSCVAVCLFDARIRAGGVNHFLLPDHTSDEAVSGRYGPSATQELLDRMYALGARAETMTARLVGGANVLSAIRVTPSLGQRNADAAMEVLVAAGVLVSARDVGGGAGRKLVFSTRDGTAWIKPLGR
jgi:chemotaxis protein CheD